MSSPRACLLEPHRFGRSDAAWIEQGSAHQAARGRAARLQHSVAVHVRAHIRTHHLTQGELAGLLGWRRERLARILIGASWASSIDLEEIAGACRITLSGIIAQNLSSAERSAAMNSVLVGYLRSELSRLEGRPSSQPRSSPRPPLR